MKQGNGRLLGERDAGNLSDNYFQGKVDLPARSFYQKDQDYEQVVEDGCASDRPRSSCIAGLETCQGRRSMIYAKCILKVPKLSEEEKADFSQFKIALEYAADVNNVRVKIEEERVWGK